MGWVDGWSNCCNTNRTVRRYFCPKSLLHEALEAYYLLIHRFRRADRYFTLISIRRAIP